ncbi:MAG: alpha/beta hydrolase [Burkholderiales bacterium]
MPPYQIETRDVEVQRHANGPVLARLYLPRGVPAGPGPFPAIVDVHGGGWTSGSRENNTTLNQALAAAGTVVAALDFRMPPEAKYPGSIADINAGIRWLKAHAREFGSRPEMVGGLGTSSGGHQILLNALRPRDPRYAAIPIAGGMDASLAFVIACWPVADPHARYFFAKERGNENLVKSHHAFWTDEAEMAEGSPHLILERGEKVELPPLLTMQGTKDANLPAGMAERFAALYRAKGGEADFIEYEDQPHAWVINLPDSVAARDATAEITRFIAKQVVRLEVRA